MIEQLFDQFVIAFREGIEASLVIMTVVMALRKRGESKLIRAAYAGIVAAVIGCIAGGYWIKSHANVEDHTISFILYLGAAITVTTMVFWMMRVGKTFRSEIQNKIAQHDSQNWLSWLGMFSFVFFMIAREGFEMTLLLLTFGPNQGGVWYGTAITTGILLAVALSYALFRGAVKFNLGKFLHSTAYVLLIFVAQLILDVFHEAIEAGFINVSHKLAESIEYLHEDVPVIAYLGLALFTGIVIYFFSQAINSRKNEKDSPMLSGSKAAKA